MSTPPASPLMIPPFVSIVAGAPSSLITQRVALPQLSTSPPSAFQIRILRSAMSEGSSRITWSQPMPVRRSAIARARAASIATAVSRPSRITKSLPSPCILMKRCVIARGDLGTGGGQVHG